MSSILVTGVAGYIGSVLARDLLSNGFYVVGLDNFEYKNHFSIKDLMSNPHFTLIERDLREDATIEDILQNDIDVVMHLAGIVGDPACNMHAEKAVKVNYDATIHLAEAMSSKDIDLFLFASTCSVYGKTASPYATEETGVNPVSLYGWTKVLSERGLKRLEEEGLPVCILRFATAHGLSPRMRFDLVVNYFTLKAVKDRSITVLGGNQWRPFIHVDDISAALQLCMENARKVLGEIFNVGTDKENYTILGLAKTVKKVIPSLNIKTLLEVRDERSYRVTFAKIIKAFNFKATKTVEDTIRETSEALTSGRFKNPSSKIYYNYPSLLG